MLTLIDKNGKKKFLIEDDGTVKNLQEDIATDVKAKDEEGSSK